MPRYKGNGGRPRLCERGKKICQFSFGVAGEYVFSCAKDYFPIPPPYPKILRA
jgi:hypothetical protein